MSRKREPNASGEPPSPAPRSRAFVGSSSGTRVLVVDPDVRFALLLKRFLEARGWGVMCVSNGREALRDWEQIGADVVVTELDGEGLDGFEFVASVRLRNPELPVVVCTRLAGVSQWKDEDQDALGIADVLLRPLQFMQLHSTLKRVLSVDG